MGPLAYRVIPPRHDGVLLVGDAAGFYDPFTGEGIFSALRGAELAAETATRALAAGDVSARGVPRYRPRPPRRLPRQGTADARDPVRDLAGAGRANLTATLLARRPGLLDLLLGVVGDYVPPGALLRGVLAR